MDVQNLIESLVKKMGSATAAASEIGVSDATLHRLRRGKNLPSRETYKSLLEVQDAFTAAEQRQRRKGRK